MFGGLAVLVLVAVVSSGCAFGQKFGYADTSIAIRQMGIGRSAAVAVLDQREYVKSGDKPESFVGWSRGGFGNKFDVGTKSGTPLASEMTTAIASALEARGLKVRSITVRPTDGPGGARQALVRTGSDRNLLFTLTEWRTDSMMRTGLDFDVSLDVLDGSGTQLAQGRVSGKEVSGASVMSAEKDAQGWFAAKVADLLRQEAIGRALQ